MMYGQSAVGRLLSHWLKLLHLQSVHRNTWRLLPFDHERQQGWWVCRCNACKGRALPIEHVCKGRALPIELACKGRALPH